MKTFWQGFRIVLEIVGAIAIVWGGGLLILRYMFKDFAGGHCTDTEQQLLASPSGKHDFKSFHRVCGTGDASFSGYFVYLSTGNPNAGYEYTPIVQIDNVATGQTKVAWDGPDQLSVTYPDSAKLTEAYAKVLGVRVVLHPTPPEISSHVK